MWNVMMYMSGDNDLSDEMVWGLQDIRDATKTLKFQENAKVVVQFDPLGGYPREYNFTSVRTDEVELHEYRADKGKDPKNRTEELQLRHFDSVAREVLAPVSNLGSAPSHTTSMATDVREPKKSKDAEVKQIETELANLINGAGSATFGMRSRQARAPDSPPDVKSWFEKQYGLILDDISVRAQLQSFVIEQIGLLERDVEDQKYMIILSGHGSGAAGDFLQDDDPRSSLSIPGIDKFLTLTRIAIEGRQRASGNGLKREWWKESGIDWSTPAAKEIKVDVLGLDTCLVSMAEVCYAVRNHVRYLLGTESFVSDSGWPYAELVKLAGSNSEAKLVAEDFVKEYGKFYGDYVEAGSSTDMVAVQLELDSEGTSDKTTMDMVATNLAKLSSSIRDMLKPLVDKPSIESGESQKLIVHLDEIEELHAVRREQLARRGEGKGFNGRQSNRYRHYDDLDKLLGGLQRKPEDVAKARKLRNALILAHWYAQSYAGQDYTDLWDFCDQLQRFLVGESGQDTTFDEIRKHCHAVQSAVDAAVSFMTRVGPASQHSHGLSVYFPWDIADYSIEYRNLEFATKAEWHEFIRTYLLVTRRVRRGQEAHITVEDGFLQADATPVIRHGVDCDPLDDPAEVDKVRYPRRGTRTHPQFGTKTHPQFGTKTHPQFGTKTHPQFGTKFSKLRGSAANNPPDGFYK